LFGDKHYQLVLEATKTIANKRTQDILNQRYGLKDGRHQTLEAVGQKYNITRERVRQIEEAAFSLLKSEEIQKSLRPVYQIIDNYFNTQGQLVREDRLLAELTKTSEVHPSRGALFFALTLGQPYKRFVESKQFYPFWISSDSALNKAVRLIGSLAGKLEKENKVVDTNYILSAVSAKFSNLSKEAILSYLDAAKEINKNNFGYFGLSHWSEINPRGVKDKAYIVFKQKKEPLHFRAVADLINEAKFDSALACPQTVHNELIKDSRFVLVGRGTYALSEWGFKPGTVKEVIWQAIKDNGPLAKEDILATVAKSRLVKENTILINLQNRKYFIRGEDGKYRLNSQP